MTIEHVLVLIGEDEPDNQIILQTVVEGLLGARAAVAGDGLEVLRCAQRQQPAVILLDLMLPGLDGLAVARSLKADPTTSGIPIIAVSAMAHPDDHQAALAAGCSAFVRKPFELSELERLLHAFVDRSA